MFQSRSLRSSPGTYLRCSLNSTEKPWKGLACRPARKPSTMNLARRSRRATWRMTSGRRDFSGLLMPISFRQGRTSSLGPAGHKWIGLRLHGLFFPDLVLNATVSDVEFLAGMVLLLERAAVAITEQDQRCRHLPHEWLVSTFLGCFPVAHQEAVEVSDETVDFLVGEFAGE